MARGNWMPRRSMSVLFKLFPTVFPCLHDSFSYASSCACVSRGNPLIENAAVPLLRVTKEKIQASVFFHTSYLSIESWTKRFLFYSSIAKPYNAEESVKALLEKGTDVLYKRELALEIEVNRCICLSFQDLNCWRANWHKPRGKMRNKERGVVPKFSHQHDH